MNKKKLYLFTENSGPTQYGIGTYVQLLIKILLPVQGIEVTLIILNSDCQHIIKQSVDNYRLIHIPAVLAPDTKQETYKIYYRNIVMLLKQYIKDSELNIYHLNYLENSYMAYWIKRLLKGRVLITIHFIPWLLGLNGNKTKLEEILSKTEKELDINQCIIKKMYHQGLAELNQCDEIICIADHSCEYFQKEIKRPSKLHMINNALSDLYPIYNGLKKRELRKKYNLPYQSKIILFSGRLAACKGLDILIRSFEKVLSVLPDCYLIIAGGGNYERAISLQDTCWSRISFTGYLPQKQLYELYRITDIGVLPSLYEEFGFSAIEMMMFQIPLIVSDCYGLSEIVIHDHTGIKIPVKENHKERILNTEDLSEAIIQLLIDKEKRKKMGLNGRKRFLKLYEAKQFQRKMTDIYSL